MKCPLCDIELRIDASRYVVENDDTADKPTKLFTEMDMYCHNKNCDNYGKMVTQIKEPLNIG